RDVTEYAAILDDTTPVELLERRPWRIAACDGVHPRPLARLPVGEDRIPVVMEAARAAEGRQLVAHAASPVDQRAVGVEDERAEVHQRRMISAEPSGGIAQPRFIVISACLTWRQPTLL